jgi:thiosulfate dehydrogenase
MRKILLFLFALGGVGLASLQGEDVLPNPVTSQQLEALLSKVHYMAPTYQEMEALKGPYGKLVRLGYLIFTQTTVYAAKYVGDGLECSNCHLDAGKLAYSAPLWAAYAHYPAYRTKNHQKNKKMKKQTRKIKK